MDVIDALKALVENNKALGWRGLYAHLGDLTLFNSVIEDVLNGEILCIAKKEVQTFSKCSVVVGFKEAHGFLGREFDHVVLYLDGLSFWPGNLIAQSVEFVRRGGVFAIHIPPSLNTRFTRYFINIALNSKNVLVVMNDKVEKLDVYSEPPKPPRRPEKKAIGDKRLDVIAELAVTQGQYDALLRYSEFLNGNAKLFFIHGDRGRGKSALIGMLMAYTMAIRPSRYFITAHSLHATQSAFQMAVKCLEKLGILKDTARDKGLIKSVKASNDAEAVYIEPWRASNVKSRPLFIDEAAAIGVARFRRLYLRVGKIVASSTTHGYEGSGRALLKDINRYFHKTIYVELQDPIRYYPGDPLEEFLYRLFHLDAEPIDVKEVEMNGLVYKAIGPDELIEDYGLLRRAYGLLVIAHYRNEPDDLVALIDGGIFELRVLQDKDGNVLCVAQLREEHLRDREEVLKSLKGVSGIAVLDKIARWGLVDKLPCKRLLRIVRIAVTPSLQRRGIGSEMLRKIEQEARRRGFDFIGSIFSNLDVIRFWVKNGYLPIYLSPRYNKVTGEKNIAVVKPLSQKARAIILDAYKSFTYYLLRTAHVLYRDVSVERLLEAIRPGERGVKPRIEDQAFRLKAVNEGLLQPEQALDVVLDYAWKVLDGLDDYERLLFISRFIQGKTLVELSKIFKKPITKINAELQSVLKKALSMLHTLRI